MQDIKITTCNLILKDLNYISKSSNKEWLVELICDVLVLSTTLTRKQMRVAAVFTSSQLNPDPKYNFLRKIFVKRIFFFSLSLTFFLFFFSSSSLCFFLFGMPFLFSLRLLFIGEDWICESHKATIIDKMKFLFHRPSPANTINVFLWLTNCTLIKPIQIDFFLGS